jgi:hypothetical protein
MQFEMIVRVGNTNDLLPIWKPPASYWNRASSMTDQWNIRVLKSFKDDLGKMQTVAIQTTEHKIFINNSTAQSLFENTIATYQYISGVLVRI